eukprot:8979632-Pyramimonas_sp.AAC.1
MSIASLAPPQDLAPAPPSASGGQANGRSEGAPILQDASCVEHWVSALNFAPSRRLVLWVSEQLACPRSPRATWP